MNINAKQVLGYLQTKAEETGTPNYGCERDELLFYVKVDGQDITKAQLENAISGDNGLRELRLIYSLKDDPKIYLSSRSNAIDPDADGATTEQQKQWFAASFVKFFKTDKDKNGDEHTLAVVKAPNCEEARIVVPILAETEDGDAEYQIDESRSSEIGCVRYMTDTRHPYRRDDDPDMPVVLAGTNLKAPGKNKFSGHWELPSELKEVGINYFKVLQRATTAAIDEVSHQGGIKTHLKLAVAYTATVAMFKSRAFKSESALEGVGNLSVSKTENDVEAMCFLDGKHIGKAYWKPCGNRGVYKGFVKLNSVMDKSDEIKEFCSVLLEAGSVRKIKPLNAKKTTTPAPENKPFENLDAELQKAQKKEKGEKSDKPTKAQKKATAKTKRVVSKKEEEPVVTGS